MINPNVTRIRDYAIKLNNSLNVSTRSNKMLEPEYIGLLKEIAKHPTNGFLVKHQYMGNNRFSNNGHKRSCNIENLKSSKNIMNLRNEILDRINTLYPKTKNLRKYIIRNDRLSVEYVKPKKGYNVMNKLAIMFQKIHDWIFKPYWG